MCLSGPQPWGRGASLSSSVKTCRGKCTVASQPLCPHRGLVGGEAGGAAVGLGEGQPQWPICSQRCWPTCPLDPAMARKHLQYLSKMMANPKEDPEPCAREEEGAEAWSMHDKLRERYQVAGWWGTRRNKSPEPTRPRVVGHRTSRPCRSGRRLCHMPSAGEREGPGLA